MEIDKPVVIGRPVMLQCIMGRMPPLVGMVRLYAVPTSPVPATNAGTASAAFIVSAVVALIAVTAGVIVAGSPESVAEILSISGLAATSAAEGVPDSTQFGDAVDIINPVIGGRPITVQLPAAKGRMPPIVGIVAV